MKVLVYFECQERNIQGLITCSSGEWVEVGYVIAWLVNNQFGITMVEIHHPPKD